MNNNNNGLVNCFLRKTGEDIPRFVAFDRGAWEHGAEENIWAQAE
jgi:hypothetical protein